MVIVASIVVGLGEVLVLVSAVSAIFTMRTEETSIGDGSGFAVPVAEAP